MDENHRLKLPDDLKKLTPAESKVLSEKIRSFLVKNVSHTGGHLSSNLGVVELTIAIYQEFNLPKDKLIFDVGHQSYVHKILSGRASAFTTLRQEGGISGFPKRSESEYDAFGAGHASTSISAAYGMAKARDLQHEDYEVVCVIGDGSMTGGMVYEAMNNAGKDKTRMIVILNDNKMSIGQNVGALASHLNSLRTRRGYLVSKHLVKSGVSKYPVLKPAYDALNHLKRKVKYLLLDGIIFEEMGFTYLGPVDGHDIQAVREVLRQAKRLKEPVFIHVLTQKGKGYEPAEAEPGVFHGVGAFDQTSGKALEECPCTWTDLFGEKICEIAGCDSKMVAITAAMRDSTGLKDFPDEKRIFDVGIAEEHAVTFAAGLAAGGMKPWVCIYSTFLQRAYDQMIHDVCLQKLPVVFCLDRSGIVGEDGETHQGVFDLSYLTSIPNLVVMAPSTPEELGMMMDFASAYDGPVAIRYPKGKPYIESVKDVLPNLETPEVVLGKAVRVQTSRPSAATAKDAIQAAEPNTSAAAAQGRRTIVLSLGDRLGSVLEACRDFEEETGNRPAVVDLRFAAPLDDELMKDLVNYDRILMVEEGVRSGSMSEHILSRLEEANYQGKAKALTLPDAFIPQGKRKDLLHRYGLDAEGVLEALRNL